MPRKTTTTITEDSGTSTVATASPADVLNLDPVQIPIYRRDIFPTNLSLSASDLGELSDLVADVTQRAKVFELPRVDRSKFPTDEEARKLVDHAMRVDHAYVTPNGNRVQNIGANPDWNTFFPDALRSFYISNTTVAQEVYKTKPNYAVDIFLQFEKPTLKIDLLTAPSNPTKNASVINVYGTNEDWVISTTEKLKDFFNKRRNYFQALHWLHGSGTYDYLLLLLFFPTITFYIYKNRAFFNAITGNQSIFFNVIAGIYVFLLSAIVARYLFQYVRWLFPPMEYYKKSRTGAYIHRAIASFIISTLFIDAVYEIVKALIVG